MPDCEKRRPGCSTQCERYLRAKATVDAAKQAARDEYDANRYLVDTHYKILKRIREKEQR